MRKLKLRDNLLAEARDTNKDRDFADMLPCRCINFKSVLHCFVWIAALRDVHAQQGVHEVMKLDLVSTYVKEHIFIIW